MAFNSGGLQVVGWLTGSEVYLLSVCGAGTSAQAGLVWGADLLVTATALTIVQVLGTGDPIRVYAAMNVLALVFGWFLVHETAGHSLEDIEGALREDRFRPALGHEPGREMQAGGVAGAGGFLVRHRSEGERIDASNCSILATIRIS